MQWKELTTSQRWVVGMFLSVPVLSSLISTYHLISLFTLGNPGWVSIILAMAFEAGAIGSLMALAVLDKMNKNIVYVVFSILLLMQIIGNVYFSFDWASTMIRQNPAWLQTFMDLFDWVIGGNLVVAKQLLAYLIGLPIPMLGVLLSKSLVDYVRTDTTTVMTEPIGSNPVVQEQPKLQEYTEPKTIHDEISFKEEDSNEIVGSNESSIDKHNDVHVARFP